MPKIVIESGKETLVSVHGKENNFFLDVYERAMKQFEEIRAYSNPNNIDYPNNIIAFCGERGQGKSTAMLNFSNIIEEKYKDECCIIKRIDPTQLEENDNIILQFLGSIMCLIKESVESGNKESTVNLLKDNLLNSINDYAELIYSIKNSKSNTTTEYQNNLQQLLIKGESLSLKEKLYAILKDFFELIGKKLLVIQIDDTDVNISRVYEILEDIRKYLIIPNVVILIAAKFEQLINCVEQHFLKEYEVLLKSPAKRLSDYEPQHISTRYMDKLIPESRRIYLPNISVFNGDIEIVCKGKGYEGFPQFKKVYIKNSKYRKNSKYSCRDFQDQILDYIYMKTGIRFLSWSSAKDIHYVIPKTMRELVHFLSFLRTLETCIDENKKIKKEIMYKNLNLFRTYFVNTWIQSNLDQGYIIFLKKFVDLTASKYHKSIITDIYNILTNSTVFTLNNKYKKVNDKSESFIDMSIYNKWKPSSEQYSLGDVLDSLIELSQILPDISILKFCFSIEVLYTIKMYRIILEPFRQEDDYPIKDFIGGDIFGFENMKLFFATAGGKTDRSIFCREIKNITNIDMNIRQNFFYRGYKDNDGNIKDNDNPNNLYKEITSGTAPFSVFYFRPSVPFIKKIERNPEDYLLFFNMEFLNWLIFEQSNKIKKYDGKERNYINLMSSFAKTAGEIAKLYDSNIDFNFLTEGSEFIDIVYNSNS